MGMLQLRSEVSLRSACRWFGRVGGISMFGGPIRVQYALLSNEHIGVQTMKK